MENTGIEEQLLKVKDKTLWSKSSSVKAGLALLTNSMPFTQARREQAMGKKENVVITK